MSFIFIAGLTWLISTLPAELQAQGEKGHSMADSLFSGVWKGTSLCQIRNSPCHDENVVLYISASTPENHFDMLASKIVNGREEEMGHIQFKYDARTKELISVSQPNAVWKFSRKENHLDGTLDYQDALFRIIYVTKQLSIP